MKNRRLNPRNISRSHLKAHPSVANMDGGVRNTYINASEGSGNSKLCPYNPHTLVFSHANNHISFSPHHCFCPIPIHSFVLEIVSPSLHFTHYLLRSDRSLPIHLVRDVGVPPSVVDGLRYESRLLVKTSCYSFGQLHPTTPLVGIMQPEYVPFGLQSTLDICSSHWNPKSDRRNPRNV